VTEDGLVCNVAARATRTRGRPGLRRCPGAVSNGPLPDGAAGWSSRREAGNARPYFLRPRQGYGIPLMRAQVDLERRARRRIAARAIRRPDQGSAHAEYRLDEAGIPGRNLEGEACPLGEAEDRQAPCASVVQLGEDGPDSLEGRAQPGLVRIQGRLDIGREPFSPHGARRDEGPAGGIEMLREAEYLLGASEPAMDEQERALRASSSAPANSTSMPRCGRRSYPGIAAS